LNTSYQVHEQLLYWLSYLSSLDEHDKAKHETNIKYSGVILSPQQHRSADTVLCFMITEETS